MNEEKHEIFIPFSCQQKFKRSRHGWCSFDEWKKLNRKRKSEKKERERKEMKEKERREIVLQPSSIINLMRVYTPFKKEMLNKIIIHHIYI